MSFFDRFTSRKGKDQTAGPKLGVVSAKGGSASGGKGKAAEETSKKAFVAVPSGKKDPEKIDAKGKGQNAASASSPTRVSSSSAHLAHAILVRPIVTEKSTQGGAKSQYTFEVATSASKTDVRRSVHHLYGVTPVSVNMLTRRGKVVRFGRTYGRTANSKKAIVTLPSGKTIDVTSA